MTSQQFGTKVGDPMATTVQSGLVVPKLTQARGRARRAELLDAGRALLGEYQLNQISLTAVAERAAIPASSAYHFFPEIAELWKELARLLAIQQSAEDLDLPQVPDWRSLVGLSLEHHCSAFNANPAARQLMLGPHTPPEIKHAACKEDFRFGTALWTVVRSQFVLPQLADSREIFFKALLISDVFFSLSVAEHDRVSAAALAEAKLATVAFLELYLPVQLARADGGQKSATPRRR